ncbi:MAG: hypothetical protein EZS28_001607 [Streblomastix strix]|uniref:Rab-GAP TBC domain-containing protein n=1 Tax=Streblomastix strix TaxID=222440 RepID=A0A5J4X6R1_9EUKA|nr:MAG: hypothetical protein EZS28_001607 [Streblomastix strix]
MSQQDGKKGNIIGNLNELELFSGPVKMLVGRRAQPIDGRLCLYIRMSDITFFITWKKGARIESGSQNELQQVAIDVRQIQSLRRIYGNDGLITIKINHMGGIALSEFLFDSVEEFNHFLNQLVGNVQTKKSLQDENLFLLNNNLTEFADLNRDNPEIIAQHQRIEEEERKKHLKKIRQKAKKKKLKEELENSQRNLELDKNPSNEPQQNQYFLRSRSISPPTKWQSKGINNNTSELDLGMSKHGSASPAKNEVQMAALAMSQHNMLQQSQPQQPQKYDWHKRSILQPPMPPPPRKRDLNTSVIRSSKSADMLLQPTPPIRYESPSSSSVSSETSSSLSEYKTKHHRMRRIEISRIRRPKKPMSATRFASFQTESGQIRNWRLFLSNILLSGATPAARAGGVWGFIFGIYPFFYTLTERKMLDQLYIERYMKLQTQASLVADEQQWFNSGIKGAASGWSMIGGPGLGGGMGQINNQIGNADLAENKRRIDIDIVRTDREQEGMANENSFLFLSARNILRAHLIMDQRLGYVQGMNDIASLILHTLAGDEVLSFQTFASLLSSLRGLFMGCGSSIPAVLSLCFRLITAMLPKVAIKLKEIECDGMVAFGELEREWAVDEEEDLKQSERLMAKKERIIEERKKKQEYVLKMKELKMKHDEFRKRVYNWEREGRKIFRQKRKIEKQIRDKQKEEEEEQRWEEEIQNERNRHWQKEQEKMLQTGYFYSNGIIIKPL